MRIFVTEFADSKKNMERELKPKTKQIINHLYKLYCMPDHESRNHWMREIANFLNEINKLSGKNKFPTEKQLYDWTYYKFKDQVTEQFYMKAMTKNITDRYNVLIDIPLDDICKEFDNICESYFRWLAGQLSKYGIVSNYEIYDKLDELV